MLQLIGMKPGKIVYQGKLKSDREVIIRYPLESDLHSFCDYINTLSKEQTFILWQGEQITLEEEKKYLDTQLAKISKNTTVQLLAFSDNKLVGNTQINLKDKVEKHVGVLGISLAKDFRGEGLGTLLMEKIIEEAKENLKGLKIITLQCFANNEVAKKLYLKMGFVEFGVLPKGLIYQDQFIDRVYMYKVVN